MNRSQNIILTICGAGAQLSWLYAWASFLLFSFFNRIYSLPETVGFFSLAALLTVVSRRRRWRMIQIIGIHLAGVVVAGLWIVHTFYYGWQPWWSRGWLTDFFNRPRNQLEWFLLIFVLGYTVVFWVAGIRFAQEVKSYTTACSRFDRGIVAFFCLFLVKLTLQTRMGIQFQDSMALWMVFPFFIFSLTEIGLARNRGDGQDKSYLSGYYAVGVLASFAAGALILGAAIFMFFLPYLKMASVAGYDLLQDAAGPLGPLVTAAIRFIFGYAQWDSAAGDLQLQSAAAEPVESGPWMLLVQKVLMWGGGTLMTVTGIVVACVVVWYAVRWLFLKPSGEEPVGAPWSLRSWWRRIKIFLYACCYWLLRNNAKRSALQYYIALQRWGRYSGFAQEPNETPLEYAGRLSHRFPHLNAEILLIIEMFQREIYGETSLSSKQIIRTRQAWKKLHSPAKWAMRIKSIMTNS
ncbi:MAG: DUF4129 domain-containing protein [bacterium]|nr:DUF4129 domain-containing protein [bacterium]